MQLILRTPNLELTDAEQEYLNKKVQHLEKYADRVADESTKIHIDIEQMDLKTTDHKIRIQGTLCVPHSILRAEIGGLTFEEAADLFIEKMRKQIERYKLKLHRRDKKGEWIPESTLENLSKAQEELPENYPKITKRKDYSHHKPMHEEEAIEQMELLGHPYYVFYSIDRDCVSVCYKRKDGHYGIIEMKSPA